MAYRYDNDLEFLSKCSNEQLKELFMILTRDPKDGETRYTEELTNSPEYKKYGREYQKYWKRIAEELQLYGGNTVVNLFRGGDGVCYREIARDVAKYLKVKLSEGASIEEIEDSIIDKFTEEMTEEEKEVILKSLDEESRKELVDSYRKNSYGTAALSSAVLLRYAIKQGGFASYKVTVMVVNFVWKKMFGKGLTLYANNLVVKTMFSFLSGPIGWAMNAWLLFDVASPAMRVTVPSVLLVSLLRKEQRAKEKDFTF